MSYTNNSIAKGFAWTAVDRFTRLAIQFVIGVIIARLITPEEYGVLGILMVFINISQVFIDSGFGSALIYKNRIDADYLNTSFVFNLSASTVLFVVIFLSASYIESFFSLRGLSDYLRVSSIVLITNSLIVVPSSILKIQLNFRAISISNVCSTIISGFLGILGAYLGYGVWALIIQLLSKSIFQFFVLYLICKWIPKLTFNKSAFLELYRYGINIFGATCLTKVVDEGTSFFIGKVLTPYNLGVYTRGNQFASLPGNTIGGVISTALFPSLSSIKNNESRFNEVYHKALEVQTLLCTPVFVWLAVMADSLVRLLITEKWIDVVPVIQILCLSRIMSSAAVATEQVLSAKGRSDLFFRQQICKMMTKFLFVIVCLPFGLMAVITGEAISTILVFFITNYFARGVSDFRVGTQLKVVAPFLYCAFIGGGVSFWSISFVDNILLKIIVGTIIIVLLYLLLLLCIGGKKTQLHYICQLVNKHNNGKD